MTASVSDQARLAWDTEAVCKRRRQVTDGSQTEIGHCGHAHNRMVAFSTRLLRAFCRGRLASFRLPGQGQGVSGHRPHEQICFADGVGKFELRLRIAYTQLFDQLRHVTFEMPATGQEDRQDDNPFEALFDQSFRTFLQLRLHELEEGQFDRQVRRFFPYGCGNAPHRIGPRRVPSAVRKKNQSRRYGSADGWVIVRCRRLLPTASFDSPLPLVHLLRQCRPTQRPLPLGG